MLQPNISHWPIRERRDITLPTQDFTVRNTPFSVSGIMDIFSHLEKWEKEYIFSGNVFNVEFLALSDFLISFKNTQEREKYKDALSWLSLSEESDYQKPIFRWDFEYWGEYFLILWARHNFDGKASDYQSYKGILFDIHNFIEPNSQIEDILSGD